MYDIQKAILEAVSMKSFGKKENKEDLISFNVNKIKLNSVWNKDEETYIKLKVHISRTFLKNTGKLLIKK